MFWMKLKMWKEHEKAFKFEENHFSLSKLVSIRLRIWKRTLTDSYIVFVLINSVEIIFGHVHYFKSIIGHKGRQKWELVYRVNSINIENVDLKL